MEKIELAGGDPLFGPSAGLVGLFAHEVWRSIQRLRGGEPRRVVWLNLGSKLNVVGCFMVSQQWWEDFDVRCDPSTQRNDLGEYAIGIRVMVRPERSRIEAWGGNFYFQSEGQTLTLIHHSHGNL